MADRGARAERRGEEGREEKWTRGEGPAEDAAVDIAGDVDNQIDVDSNSSSDNELLGKVVRAPHGSD